MLDYNAIQEKWRKEWEEAKIFEAEPIPDQESYMVFAAFPYPNSPQHIGHLRTYGTADLLARYKRSRGYNVLFPMAFHATGTPVLAFAKRIKEGDKDLIQDLKVFHVPDQDIAQMTDPLFIANYFIQEIEEGMKLTGYSIDWRRKFVTIDPKFSKFIEWQFGILKGKGYLTQGKHPVGWCPNENNAVGMHDTRHDVEPEIDKETAIKFKVENEDAYMVCSTYRPETIFGVTNLFINDNAKYALCRIDGKEKYYVAEESAKILKYQMEIDIEKIVSAREMLAKRCINPITNVSIPVLPGFFVKEKVGTGVVMSVPAHAPFDYAALERLKASGYRMEEIKPIKLIDVQVGRSLSDVAVGEAKPVHQDIPALAYLEVLHTHANAIDDMLEFATKLEYREESHWGKMIVKGYEGLSEPEARDKIKQMLISNGKAFEIYVLTNAPVVCRCGYEVVVRVLDDQWFINYGDKNWKTEARTALNNMNILPPKSKPAFEDALEWIGLRAVTRAQGLGTKFPFDEKFIIESLSDSTIYPAFYTISNLVADVQVESLNKEFFDYVFLGKGDIDNVSKATGIDYSLIKRCRESFDYWYVMTSNHSGPDLIYNHFTMYTYNHVAVFDRKYWPKQAVANGMVLSEGEKMSKSLGNILPLVDAVKKYGADPLRINIVAGADLYSDSDFSDEAVKGISERLNYIYNTIMEVDKYESKELKRIDYWLYSVLNRKIEAATKQMDKLELRDAITNILYDSVIELRRYFERGGDNSLVIKEFLQSLVLMLQPFAPYFAEETWQQLGNMGFVSVQRWPDSDKGMINDNLEEEEKLVDSVVDDAKQAISIMNKKQAKKPSTIRVIVADDWKRQLNNSFAKDRNKQKLFDTLKTGDYPKNENAAKFVETLVKKANEVREISITQKDEFDAYVEAKSYLSSKLDAQITIEKESTSKSNRASRAMPLKPSIEIIF